MPGPDAESEAICRHCWIRGRVQMVGYRAFAVAEARRRGLDGFVRNCADGRVEVVVQGSPTEVDSFLARLRRGPAAAQVDLVQIEEMAPGLNPSPFQAVA